MTYNLHFEGSVSDAMHTCLPQYSGVYLVYRGRFDAKDNLFYCMEILYIGQAENIRNRIMNHERRQDFLQECRRGETIFYSYAQCQNSILNMVENAYIYVMKPRLNTIGVDSYKYITPIQIISDGACALLNTNFEIQSS